MPHKLKLLALVFSIISYSSSVYSVDTTLEQSTDNSFAPGGSTNDVSLAQSDLFQMLANFENVTSLGNMVGVNHGRGTRVGVAYAYGEGVRQDTKLAAEWYQKAAAQGHTIAQRNLAMMYLYGNGLQKNKVHALAWYNIIASQGNVMDIRRRDILQKEFSQNELAQSEKLSNEILNRLNSNTSL